MPKIIRWCVYPGCSFFAKKDMAELEQHAVEAHGVQPGSPKPLRPTVDQEQLFDRDAYLRDRL